MKIKFRFCLVALFTLFFINSGNAAPGGDVTGVWTTEQGRSKIEIYSCGANICGKIVWLKEPNYPANDDEGMAGQVKIDRNNPEKSLRTRPILGLPLLNGFHFAGDNVWNGGTIYDPESGKTYQAKMELVSSRKLNLRGYVGIPLFGRTSSWYR